MFNSHARRRVSWSAVEKMSVQLPGKERVVRTNGTDWRGVAAAAALWMIAYCLVWGLAWLVFMRREWTDAVASINRQSPWTAEVWFMELVFTFPMGVAISAHAASQKSLTLKTAMYPAVALWMMMTVGMAIWSAQEGFPLRVIVLDSTVNLVAMLAGSLACWWSLRRNSTATNAPSTGSPTGA